MAEFHHRKLPTRSTLLPPDDVGFQSRQLQIWYNTTDQGWVGEGEAPHLHTESDECFIVLRGALVVEVDRQRHTIGPREFCCFPRGVLHAIVEVQTPVETLMIRAPSTHDKIYEVNRPKDVNRQ